LDLSVTAPTSESGPSSQPPSLFKVRDEDDDYDEDEDMKDASQEQPLTQNQQNLANHDLWKRKRAEEEENYDDE